MTRKNAPPTKVINHRVPYLTWVRLRAYSRSYGLTIPRALDSALNKGLDLVGIPQDAETLLGKAGSDDA